MTEFCDSFGIYHSWPLGIGGDGGVSQRSILTRWNWAGFGAQIVPAASPRGTNALWIPWNGAVAKTHSHHSTFTQGFRLKMAQIGGVGGGSIGEGLAIFLNCDLTLLSLAVNLDGSLYVYGNGSPSTVICTTGSTSVISPDTWCYLEWTATLADAVGGTDMLATVSVWINNKLVCTGSHLMGRPSWQLRSGTPTFNRVFLLSGVNTDGQAYFADYYLTNGDGPTNMGRLGGSRSPYGVLVEPFFPASDGSSLDWIPSTGTDHYAMVNEVIADMDTSYNSSSTLDAVDSYVWQQLPTFIGTIKSAQLSFIARSTEEGTRVIKANIGVGGLEIQGSPFALCSTYFYQHHAFDVDPATTLPWLQPAFNSKNFGVTLTT
jgi:hypothetical protein